MEQQQFLLKIYLIQQKKKIWKNYLNVMEKLKIFVLVLIMEQGG